MDNNDWFCNSHIVTLELSNLCNYARLHSKCPAHEIQTPEILSSVAVTDVIDTLANQNYGVGKFLAFHVYNEPLLDPRLFKFIDYARSKLGQINIILWSNGWYLYETIAEELAQAGITHFMVSAYSDAEYERFTALRNWLRTRLRSRLAMDALPVFFQVRRVRELDERMHRLALAPQNCLPCHQPLNNLTIRANGDIGLCCYDWAQEETFGNINRAPFAECLTSNYARLEAVYRSLVNGERELTVCQACDTPRRAATEAIPSYWPESTLVTERVPS